MGRRRKKSPLKLDIRPETVQTLVALGFIFLGILIVISFTGQGAILAGINAFFSREFGWSMLFLPFVSIAAGLVLFHTQHFWTKPHVLLGTVLIMIGCLGFFRTGVIGTNTFTNLALLVSSPGAMTIFFALFAAGVIIMTQLTISEILAILSKLKPAPSYKKSDDSIFEEGGGFSLPKLSLGKQSQFPVEDMSSQNKKKGKDEPENDLAIPHIPVSPEAAEKSVHEPADPNFIWEYPPLSLLSDKVGGEANRGDVKANAEIIERTLGSFGIKAHVAEVNYGPAVTQYALEIALGTKLSKITALSTDLALALAAPTGQIRIEAPIAGRALVGVEVPNHSAQFVTLRQMLSNDKMKKHHSKLAVALGLNVAGQEIVADIGKMPHVLIAGATGSGKSVAINSFICSMLFRASPNEVKFIFVDPKRVELTAYANIPHLITPVIVDPKKVVSALKWATHEMDNRYKMLAEVGVKNIDAYNELAGFQQMPSIVIIIDELADIMLFAPREVEECVTRIAQMARAVGIHLVLATQRPSVDVLTGLIKANIPTRVAFNVSSMMDSRVILDQPGAEKLLGRGDMLYIPPDQAKASRIQGTYVSEPEIKKLVDFIRNQGVKPEYKEEITTKYEATEVRGGSGEEGGHDPLFEQALSFVFQSQQASASAFQRKFSVGYARAARILDQLNQGGFVGPAQGAKPRELNQTLIRDYLAKAGQGN